jgi:hypothetical protein
MTGSVSAVHVPECGAELLDATNVDGTISSSPVQLHPYTKARGQFVRLRQQFYSRRHDPKNRTRVWIGFSTINLKRGRRISIRCVKVHGCPRDLLEVQRRKLHTRAQTEDGRGAAHTVSDILAGRSLSS